MQDTITSNTLAKSEVREATAKDISMDKSEALAFRSQLDSMRHLEDGWADGISYTPNKGKCETRAPSQSGLDWLAGALCSRYPEDLPKPYLYPTPEGGVQAEWTLGNNEIVFEIDIDSHSAYWLWFDRTSDDDDERELDLDNAKVWEWLVAEIRSKADA